MTNAPIKDNDTRILLGGEKILVADNQGEPVELFVRILPVRLIDDYLRTVLDGKHQETVELLVDRPKDWADRLPIEAVEAILEKGDALNFPNAERMLQRKERTVARFVPHFRKITGSLDSARTSPSPPGSPEPGS